MSQSTVNAQDVLSSVRLFHGLDHKHIAQIARTAHVRTYAPGEEVVREGEEGIGLYAIASGEVEVFQTKDGQERPLRTMHTGEAFGELSLLAKHSRTATVRATQETECLVFTAWNFKAMLDESPEIAVPLASTLAAWLIESEDRAAAVR